MKEQMEAELQEMIRTLEKANGALARIFNMEEGESEMTKWECTECSSNHTMPRDFGCDDCDQDGAMKGREYYE
jgi:hypothetical protein